VQITASVPAKIISLDFYRQKKDALPKVNIGIVANVECSCFSPDHRVAANERVIQNDINQVRKRPDNGIFNDGVINVGVLTNCCIGPDDGIFDHAAFADAHRLNKNRVLVFG
jgi:hypothetical protein